MKHLKTFEQIKMPNKELTANSTNREISIKNQYTFGGKLYVKNSEFPRIYQNKEKPMKRDWILSLNEKLDIGIKYYKNWFDKPDTKKKLKNPKVISKLIGFLDSIRIFALSPPFSVENAQAYVFDWVNDELSYEKWGKGLHPFTIFYNCENFDRNYMESTIIHEIGHLIDFILRKNGEKNIYDKEHKCQGVIKPSNSDPPWMSWLGIQKGEDRTKIDRRKNQTYIETPTEIYARLQEFRKSLGLRPVETPQNVISKIIDGMFDGTLEWKTITNYTRTKDDDTETISYDNPKQIMTIIDGGKKLCFTPTKIGPKYLPTTSIVDLKDGIDLKDGNSRHTYGELLINFAEVKGGKLIIDFQKLCNVNNELVKNKDLDSVASKTG
jgi:hypothetical protein